MILKLSRDLDTEIIVDPLNKFEVSSLEENTILDFTDEYTVGIIHFLINSKLVSNRISMMHYFRDP